MSDLFNKYARADSPFGDNQPESAMRWASEEINKLRQQLEQAEARVAELESREDAMCDLAYANGAKQGFSLGQMSDNEGLQQIVAPRYLNGIAELKRLRQQADELERKQ